MHSILLQVFRGNWYIEPDFAKSAAFLIQQMANGKLAFDQSNQEFKPQINSYNSHAQGNSTNQKSSAIISITGPMMKHDQFCGPAGMDSIGHWIKVMDDDPSVESIILKLSTPGGTVEGTANLGKIITDTKKPIIAFIDELACSGGYWIASQCDRIIASTPRARVGSVGVMLSFADLQPAWEKEGVVFHEIYSTLSPDKNKDFAEIRDGKYENYRKDVLDPLATDFINLVKESRENIDKELLKGKVIFALDAVDAGMIDSINSLEETIQISFNLAQERKESASTATPNVQSNNKLSMKNLPIISALLQIDALESTDEGIHLSQEAIESIEAAIAESDTRQNTISERDNTIESLTNDISSRDDRITELESQVSNLIISAGSESASVTSTKDIDDTEESLDEMTARLNSTDDMSERIEIMREYGYGK